MPGGQRKQNWSVASGVNKRGVFLNLSSGVLSCATSECGRPRMLHRGGQWLHRPAAPPRGLQNQPEWRVQRGTGSSEHRQGRSRRLPAGGAFSHGSVLLRRSIPSKKSLECQHLRWSSFRMWPKFSSTTSFVEKTVRTKFVNFFRCGHGEGVGACPIGAKAACTPG